MLGVGMLVTWTGYAFASWGYCLVRGWDICLRSWLSPLHPYQWHGTPGSIDPTVIFPRCPGGASTTGLTAGPNQTHSQTRPFPDQARNSLQSPDFQV